MTERVIILQEHVDGTWTAKDETEKITVQADTRSEALSTLDDVTDTIENNEDHEPTYEELGEVIINHKENRTLDELDLGGSAPDGRWPSTDE